MHGRDFHISHWCRAIENFSHCKYRARNLHHTCPIFVERFFHFLTRLEPYTSENHFTTLCNFSFSAHISILSTRCRSVACGFSTFSHGFNMDLTEFYIVVGILFALGYTYIRRRRRKRKVVRKCWMREWLRRRDDPGFYTIMSLYKELLDVSFYLFFNKV